MFPTLARRLLERALAPGRAGRGTRRVRTTPGIRGPLSLEWLECRALPSTVHWVGDSGDWGDPGNWVDASTLTHRTPTAGDDAVIAVPGVTVTHAAGTDAVGCVAASGGAVRFAGGTLTVGGALRGGSTFTLEGGTLAGATVAPGTTLRGTSLGGTLSGVTVNGTLDLTAGFAARADVTNGLTVNGTANLGSSSGSSTGYLNFIGTQTLGGTGNVVFGGSTQNELEIFNGSPGAVLTLGPGLTVHGQSGQIQYGSSYSFVNQGTVRADTTGGAITLGGGISGGSSPWVNAGTLQATAGTLTLAGNWASQGTIAATGATLELGTVRNRATTWSNTGTITATNATVHLNALFTRAGLGTFTRTGGTVALRGILDNRGGTLSLDANTGSWVLDRDQGDNGGGIVGGTVTATAGARLQVAVNGGNLDGVTLNGDLDLTASATTVYVTDGLTLNGTAWLGDAAGLWHSALYFRGTQTLAGTANVLLGGYALAGRFYVDGLYVDTPGGTDPAVLTLGPAVTVHGDSGFLGPLSGGGGFINQGALRADVAGGQIKLDGNWTNAGTIQAGPGTTVTAQGSWANAGTLQAQDGATLNLAGLWSNTGALAAANATVNLGGSFVLADAGTFSRTGGTVTLSGILQNTGHTLALNPSTGDWQLAGGTVVGGTVTEAGGAQLLFLGSGGRLTGVTFDGDMDLTAADVFLSVSGGLTLNGTARLGDAAGTTAATLVVSDPQPLDGAATVVFGGQDNNLLAFGAAGSVLGPNVTVRGQSGQVYSAGDGFVNRGTVSADVAGGTLYVGGNNWTNAGTIRATGGGTAAVYGTLTNYAPGGGGTLTGGTWQANAGSTLRFLLSDGAGHDLPADVGTNAAAIVLDGPGSNVVTGSGLTDALAGLARNAGAGRFTVRDGRTFDTGGDFTNSGALTVGAGSRFTVTGRLTDFDGATLTGGSYVVGGTFQFPGAWLALNAATLVLDGAGSQVVDEAGHDALVNFAVNLAGGSFTVQNGRTFTAGDFENDGALAVGPGSALTVAGFFLQTGTLGVAPTGVATLAGGGANDGSFNLDGGATLTFPGGTFLLDVGAAVNGPGLVRINGATVSAVYQLSVANLELAGGTLTGDGSVTVTGTLTWTGGTLSGAGTTTLAPGSRLTLGGAALTLDTRLLDLHGTTTWGDGVTLTLANGAWLDNESDGLLTFESNASLLGNGYLANDGTLIKGGAGTVAVAAGIAVTNTGGVAVRGGTFGVDGGYTQSGGLTAVSAGATLAAAGGVNVLGGTLAGAGTIRGDVTNNGTVAVGDDTAVGVLTIDGNYTQTADGTLSLEVGGPTAGTDYGQLAILGNALLAGTLSVTEINGYMPASGTGFALLTFASCGGMFDTLANDGLQFAARYDQTDVTLVVP
jgi:hypothetical protein